MSADFPRCACAALPLDVLAVLTRNVLLVREGPSSDVAPHYFVAPLFVVV